ncbi:autotransporter-associated beta strand repeat-containing protein [Methyloversatilis sp. XJ19-49]|uniref:autotransporter-associated beta strand repeat-containing protein n=1 Tax=Methyloversatilis sp. XJ19-49 TaxID=2963429 RepID=UPI00211C1881|nr:autotransporter-associated beta strand repeat-containing protein [Methyloversatilis sp. XJ19-49]MCQ9378896.1 autotransporter-associated beta strand repeat-containing protein [Methyloversatilis sp. XJ19-49]
MALVLAAPLPVAAGLYDGPVDPTSLAAAYEGWRKLKDEVYLIVPNNGAIYGGGFNLCCSSGVVFHGVSYGPDYWPWFHSWSAFSDADLGEPGATLYLGSELLVIGASFDTFRDVVIGYTTSQSGVDYVELPILTPDGTPVPAPTPMPVVPRPAGPAWIDTQGNTFGIHGQVTAHQTLYKQGAGTLRLTHANNVWHAAPVVSYGVLAANAGSLRTDVLLRGGALMFEQSDAGHFDHVVSGTGTVVKAGSAELLLTRAQTFTGDLHVAEGRLTFAADADPGQSPRILVALDATLDLAARTTTTEAASLAGAGDVVLGGGALLISGVPQPGDTFAGRLSGAGMLEVGNNARIELTGHNTQAGGTLVRGTLIAGRDASLGAAGQALRLDGGRLQLSSALELARALHSIGGSAVDLGDHRLTLAEGLSGSGVLDKTGSGELALTQAGRFTGTVDVRAGTLALQGRGSTGDASHIDLARDAVLDLAAADGARTLAGLSNVEGGATVRLGNNTLRVHESTGTQFHGRIEGTGAFEKDGSGTLVVGDAAWTGTTRVLAGELSVSPGLASQRVQNEGVLRMTNADTTAWSGEFSGAGRFVKSGEGLLWLRGASTQAFVEVQQGALVGRSSTLGRDIDVAHGAGVGFFIDEDDTHHGTVRGAGVLYSYGSGALTLAGTYAHSGGTAISNTLHIDSDARLGDARGGLLIAGGTLQALDDLTLRRHIALGADGGTLDSNGFDITLIGRIDGPGGLTKAGSGRLTLLGDYDYAGHTVVAAGELVFGGALEGSFEVLAGARLVASGVLGGDISVAEGGSLLLTSDVLSVTGLIDLGGTLNFDFAGGLRTGPLLAAGTLMISQVVDLSLSGFDPAHRAQRIELARANEVVFAQAGRLTLSGDLTQAGYRLDVSNGTLALIAAPVPEPSTISLLLAGLGLIAFRSGRC